MPLRRYVTLLLLLLSAFAVAQSTPSGPLAAVVVEGTTSYADIVRVVLSAREGTPASSIDLEAERNRVYALGTFQEVSVNLEARNAGPTLVVRVRENPIVADVVFSGVSAIDPGLLEEALERENLLAAGRVYNTTRAEQAIATIQAVYRRNGFPFDVPVTLAVSSSGSEAGADAPVVLSYTVEEAAPIAEVTFEGATVLDAAALEAVFGPLERAGEFNLAAYRKAIGEVADRYAAEGFRGSGVDPATSELSNGTLAVGLRELEIVAIDTSAIGVDESELSLAPGDLFDYDTLLADVKRLAQGRSDDIRLEPQITSSGDVRVTFELGPPDSAGPIDTVEVSGNTVVPSDEIRGLLALREGDTFTSTLAQEDFQRIRDRYQQSGYLILNQPDFNYLDGTYVQRITELKVAGYDVTFEGGRDNTQDFVITRYMPPVGTVLNQNALRNSLQQIARLGAVEPVTATLEPTDAADEVRVNVVVREISTGTFTPTAQYSTESGLSASVSYNETNFLGRAHDVSVELNGQSSDVGLLFGGSLRYSIPWLYIDALDFEEVPTSLSASIFSLVNTNQLLTANGSLRAPYPGLPANEANQVLAGEYTQRDTGLSVSVGRPVFENTTLRFSARGAVTEYKLEPPAVACTFDGSGNLSNANRCSLPREEALRYLPQGGLSSFVSTTLSYDDRDNPDFPRRGVAATALVGVGIGSDYRNPASGQQQFYDYEQVEFGVKTYLQLKDLLPDSVSDPNHVFAFRLNFGHQFGGDYPASKRFQVGKTTIEGTSIRGYQIGDFNLSRTYVTGSVEYRYDFGLRTVATQTVVGIAFVDLGYASSVPGFPEYGAPLFAGAGVGLQINLGFSGVVLPAVRFDYGFSERHPSGEFRFRVGPVF